MFQPIQPRPPAPPPAPPPPRNISPSLDDARKMDSTFNQSEWKEIIVFIIVLILISILFTYWKYDADQRHEEKASFEVQDKKCVGEP